MLRDRQQDNATDDRTRRDLVQAVDAAVGGVLDPADSKWTHETGQVAGGVYQRDARRSSRSREERGLSSLAYL